MTTLYNKSLEENKELHSTIDTLDAKIAMFAEKLAYVADFQYRMQDQLKGCHHIGNFTAANRVSKKWEHGITGTVEGFLGFLPIDTGLATKWSFDVVQDNKTVRIKTYTWNQRVDTNDQKQLWGEFINACWSDELAYMHRHTYPQFDFPAIVGYHYDPDPPEPSWHTSGLVIELLTFRTDSIFTPSYGRQNKMLMTILNNYVRRVMPFVRELQQFLDKAL
uniref:Orf2 n=8 Tax=Craigies Hill virus TaxID=1654362 RepID=A0A0F7KMQ2_9VIRU|nr:orf2 [Craigies Hill virus]AWY11117.1 orf2 [Craigies Hill virus]AWY11136.1 orf2 [Craigies Hill virus]AWY11156.1 orf2 [Craigies Hill virus]AWY11159.1 orf2 [Craigies Hill virus]